VKTLESKALAIKKETEEDRKILEQEKESFHKEKELMSQRYKIDDTIIELNVGGTHFTSFKTTLCKIEDSMLAAMFSGRHPLTKDSKGRFFIDRDPVAFKMILNYLRTGKWNFPENKTEMSNLREEINYFGLMQDHCLKYSFDMDTNGVFYYLGADGTSQWKNPTVNGKVVVTCSSLSTGNANLLLDRKMNQSCHSSNDHSSWFSFELTTATLQPSYYTLCSDTNRGYCTRNWDLEASNDGKIWITLRSHLNDQTFNAASQPHSWPITATKYFSQFRVRQTGPNSQSNYHLMVGGFELYVILQEI